MSNYVNFLKVVKLTHRMWVQFKSYFDTRDKTSSLIITVYYVYTFILEKDKFYKRLNIYIYINFNINSKNLSKKYITEAEYVYI